MNTLHSRPPQKPRTDQFGVVFRCCTDSPTVKALKNLEFRVYVMLLVCAGGAREGVTISTDKLAERSGLARSTFFRGLKTLRDLGLVDVKRFGAINGEKTGANRWFIYNPPDVTPFLNGSPFGLSFGTEGKLKSDEGRLTRPDEGRPRNGTHSGATGTSGNSIDGQSEIPNSETPNVNKHGETLTGFLGKTINELHLELEAMDKREQGKALFGSNSLIELIGPIDTFAKWWDLDHFFKERLAHFSEDEWGLGYNFVMDRAVKSFAPVPGSAQTRAAFLTECQHIVQAQGR
jgi:predicted transcriptional regulator